MRHGMCTKAVVHEHDYEGSLQRPLLLGCFQSVQPRYPVQYSVQYIVRVKDVLTIGSLAIPTYYKYKEWETEILIC